MAPTTAAAVLLLPAAAALMLMTALHPPGAAAGAPPPAPTVKRNCNRTCGNLSVPYPFVFGPSGCYWPGLNLTCDTSHGGTPRLLLGNGALRVTHIFFDNATVRVMRAGSILNTTGDLTSDGWNVSFGRSFTDHGYQLSYRNELVVSGCNVMATLLADTGDAKAPGIGIAGCASFCDLNDNNTWFDDMPFEAEMSNRKYCAGALSCCQAPVGHTSPPKEVQAKWLYSGNHTKEQRYAPVNVFVAEEGWVDQNRRLVADKLEEVPLVLSWMVTRGLPQGPRHGDHGGCPDDVTRMLCKSEQSSCSYHQPAGYTCHCLKGYEGNPYISGGCVDFDECQLPSEENGCLWGACINTIGGMECRCPHGTYGSPSVNGGCIKSNYSTIAAAPDTLLPMADPAQIGLPGCNTRCGEVVVPYPFGISPGCYWPGFKLICNTSDDHPRLLLDSGSILEVVNISLPDSMVRVSYRTSTSFTTSNFSDKVTSDNFQILDMSETYTLSTRNELILFGCDVQATLYGEYTNHGGNISITSDKCVSYCNSGYLRGYCSGHDGCCHVPISAVSKSKEVYMKIQKLTIYEEETSSFALISEQGMTDQWYNMLDMCRICVWYDYDWT